MEKKKKYFDKIELLFKLFYLAFVLISFNSFCARASYISYLSYAIVALGAFVFLTRLTHLKDYLNRNVWILLAFVFSYALASIKTMQYGLMENIQAIAWMGLMFFTVFAYDKTRDRETFLFEFKYLSGFFLVYTFIMAIIGIAMMILNFAYLKVVDDTNIYIIGGGFIWNRLYGCYMDPTYGSIFALTSIIFSIYYLKIVSSKRLKGLLVANIILEFIHMSCSDSRTALVALFLAATVCVFLLLKDKGKNILVSALIAVVVAVLLMGSAVGIQKVAGVIHMKTAEWYYSDENLSEEELAILLDEYRLGRTEDEINGGDLSNNRFAIWANAIDIFKTNPVTGISFRNIIEYARDKMPEGFIAKSGFESMHNSIIDILVSQGVIGIALFVALVVSVFITIFKKAPLLTGDDRRMFIYFFTCLTLIFGSMMFYSETFYMNTGSAFNFWMILGILVNYILPNAKEEAV